MHTFDFVLSEGITGNKLVCFHPECKSFYDSLTVLVFNGTNVLIIVLVAFGHI